MVTLHKDEVWTKNKSTHLDLNNLLQKSDCVVLKNEFALIYKVLKQILKKKDMIASLISGKLIFNTDTYTISLDTKVESPYPLYFNKEDIQSSKLLLKADIVSIQKTSEDKTYLDTYKIKDKNFTQFEIGSSRAKIDTTTKGNTKNISLPKSAHLVSSLKIDAENVNQLVNATKINKNNHNYLYVHKETFEIGRVYIGSYSINFSDHTFNADIDNENYALVEVPELFPIKINGMWITINLYHHDKDFYLQLKTEFKQPNDYIQSCILVKKVGFNEAPDDMLETEDEMTIGKKINLVPKYQDFISSELKSFTQLNKFKFTVKIEDKEFLNFIEQLLTKNNAVRVQSNEKIKLYGYSLKELESVTIDSNQKELYSICLNSVFLEIKITNGIDYTFTFSDLGESFKSKEFDIYNTILETIQRRTTILKSVLNYLKNYNLYKSTKIKSIGFTTTFKNPEYFKNIKLIQFNTDPKKPLYKCYDYKNQGEVYTATSCYYKTYLKEYKRIISYFQDKNKKDPLSNIPFEQLSDTQIKEVLEKTISTKFKHGIKITAYKEAQNIYYVKAESNGKLNLQTKPIQNDLELVKESLDEKLGKVTYTVKIKDENKMILDFYKKHKLNLINYKIIDETLNINNGRICYILEDYIDNLMNKTCDIYVYLGDDGSYYASLVSNGSIHIPKPIKISKDITLQFKLEIDSKSNYFKIYHSNSNSEFVSNYKYKQLEYSYEVDRWETRKEELLEHDAKKYYFTLDSDITHIVDNLKSFTKKHKLVFSDRYELIEKISSVKFKSKKELEDNVDKYRAIDYLENEESNIKDILSDIL